MRGLRRDPGSGGICRSDRVIAEVKVGSRQEMEQYQLRSRNTPTIWTDISAWPFPQSFRHQLRGLRLPLFLTRPQAGLLHLVSLM
jgi:hypothetical protein